MPLVFFRGLAVSCYVGGAGGGQYLQQAKYVADQMRIAFAPVAIWRPHDRYLGLSQLEALLTLKKLTGSFDLPERGAAQAALRDRLAAIHERIDELETRKKKITDSIGERSEKINQIRDLSRQQDTTRRENGSAMLARQLGLLENSERVLTVYPCIIDYAVNLGLGNVSEQWEAFLRTIGDFRSDVTLRSALDQQLSLLGLQPSWSISIEDFKHDGID
jgi:hypothetical protein